MGSQPACCLQLVTGLKDLAVSAGVAIRTRSRVVRINTVSDTSSYQSGDDSDGEYSRWGGRRVGRPN